MTKTPPPPEWGSASAGPSRGFRLLTWLAVVPLLLALGFGYVWFIQRIEVPAGHFMVLVRKVGERLPATLEQEASLENLSTQTVLHPELLKALGEPEDSTRYKGVVFKVEEEGRYFLDPFFWNRDIHPAVFIGQNEVGLLIRKFGKPLPPGRIVATEPDERGPLAEVLMPARYNINPHAFEVKRVPPVRIPAGYVGVQVLLHGNPPSNPNDWIVKPGERGVQPEVLPAGLYFNNPYVRRIEFIDVRSHTLDLREDDAIRFPSSDSFEIVLEATVEYAISQDKAPYVMVAIGEHKDIEEKLILPYARSLSRIEGSKLLAKEFIAGETREGFQNAFFDGLREQCAAQGIEIRATPIRRIVPPIEIAGPISLRQVAGQQINQFRNEIKVAEAEASLVEQEEMRAQNQEIGVANRGVVTLIKEAEQDRAVALTEANKRLEVARLQLEAAKETAAAIISRGEADAEVITLDYEAHAKPLAEAVAAFGGGDAYAQYFFYQRLAPALKSVLASTDGPFAEILRSLSREPGRPPVVASEGGEQ